MSYHVTSRHANTVVCIAVTNPLALCVSPVELLCFGLALDHWVHRFQVGGVGHEGQRDVLVSFPVDALMVHAQVVLHIPRALRHIQEEWPSCGPIWGSI